MRLSTAVPPDNILTWIGGHGGQLGQGANEASQGHESSVKAMAGGAAGLSSQAISGISQASASAQRRKDNSPEGLKKAALAANAHEKLRGELMGNSAADNAQKSNGGADANTATPMKGE